MSEGGCGCCGKPSNECYCRIDNRTGTKADLVCRTHNKAWYAKVPGSGVAGWVVL